MCIFNRSNRTDISLGDIFEVFVYVISEKESGESLTVVFDEGNDRSKKDKVGLQGLHGNLWCVDISQQSFL